MQAPVEVCVSNDAYSTHFWRDARDVDLKLKISNFFVLTLFNIATVE